MCRSDAAEYSDPLTIELLQLATLLMRCHTAKLAQSDYRQQLLTFGCGDEPRPVSF
jgi:hypothetical protein